MTPSASSTPPSTYRSVSTTSSLASHPPGRHATRTSTTSPNAALAAPKTSHGPPPRLVPSSFITYWAQRISTAIVTADARRCLRRLPALRGIVAMHKQPSAPRAVNAGFD